MASGWLCGQTARDFTVTKTGRKGSMDIQKADEFKTTKFFCKTNFDMNAIKSLAETLYETKINAGLSPEQARDEIKNIEPFNNFEELINSL